MCLDQVPTWAPYWPYGLLSVLLRFELFFDGTFGDWNLPHVSTELKETVKPYHGRPYFILHKHKAVLMKEIKRLCNIWVLEWQPSFQWASLTFIIHKKDSTVHTNISHFRELNKCIVRKPYPIPKMVPCFCFFSSAPSHGIPVGNSCTMA